MAVRPAPRIPRMCRSLNDFPDPLEGLDSRTPMASAADKVGPMRVGVGGTDLRVFFLVRPDLLVPYRRGVGSMRSADCPVS